MVGEYEKCLTDNQASWTVDGCPMCIHGIKGFCLTMVAQCFYHWECKPGSLCPVSVPDLFGYSQVKKL